MLQRYYPCVFILFFCENLAWRIYATFWVQIHCCVVCKFTLYLAMIHTAISVYFHRES